MPISMHLFLLPNPPSRTPFFLPCFSCLVFQIFVFPVKPKILNFPPNSRSNPTGARAFRYDEPHEFSFIVVISAWENRYCRTSTTLYVLTLREACWSSFSGAKALLPRSDLSPGGLLYRSPYIIKPPYIFMYTYGCDHLCYFSNWTNGSLEASVASCSTIRRAWREYLHAALLACRPPLLPNCAHGNCGHIRVEKGGLTVLGDGDKMIRTTMDQDGNASGEGHLPLGSGLQGKVNLQIGKQDVIMGTLTYQGDRSSSLVSCPPHPSLPV